MTEIKGLKVSRGLSSSARKELVTEFVDVSQFSKVRLVSCSDVSMDIALEWSIDSSVGIEGISLYTESHRCLSKTWRVSRFATSFPYLRLRITNNSGTENDYLQVRVYGEPASLFPSDQRLDTRLRSSSIPDSPPTRPSSPLPKPRSKTIFSKSKDRPRTPTGCDPLPGYIPEGSLLVGDKVGKLKCLPRGEDGQYLMMVEGSPCWSLPYPPRDYN